MTSIDLQQAAHDLPLEDRPGLAEALWEGIERNTLPERQWRLVRENLVDLEVNQEPDFSREEAEVRTGPTDS